MSRTRSAAQFRLYHERRSFAVTPDHAGKAAAVNLDGHQHLTIRRC